jgi:hypothetical protein
MTTTRPRSRALARALKAKYSVLNCEERRSETARCPQAPTSLPARLVTIQAAGPNETPRN